MKTRTITLFVLTALFFLAPMQSGFAAHKVLVIVDNDRYSNISYQVDLYVQDIISYDMKKAELTLWTSGTGTNEEMCTPLLQYLQQEYVAAIAAGDSLEGAVLIGNVPVPMYVEGGDYWPFDQVFMDIVDANGQPYIPSPFNTENGYYKRIYSGGDSKYDIWVSRINAAYLHGQLRQGYVYDENDIYRSYLNRVNSRMCDPETVPSRGFAMGGCLNGYPSLDDVHGNMRNLGLPWFAEFPNGEASPFNWMSQLMGGPYGTINYGAFNGSLFPSERNRRYCRYTQLPVYEYGSGSTTPVTTTNDSLGWEWAGLYAHSDPTHSNFISQGGEAVTLNGQFQFGTFAPFWGTDCRRTNEGYNGGYYYYNAQTMSNPDIYNYGYSYYGYNPYNGKSAKWRFPVTASKDYNIYIYYVADPVKNAASVGVRLVDASLDGNGIPIDIIDINPDPYNSILTFSLNQQSHVNFIETNWELLSVSNPITLNFGTMAIVQICAGGGWDKDVIVDAVRFKSTDGQVDQIVDDLDPASYPDVDNNPAGVFSTRGFWTNDEVDRNYEDMGEEPGGAGLSKTRFFTMNCCEINNWVHANPTTNPYAIDKNIGNLYALGHNGLICMGASTLDWPPWPNGNYDKDTYINSLATGYDFGQAYLAQSNYAFQYHGLALCFALLGAGTLRAQPYIQYGSEKYCGLYISTTMTINTANPVLLCNDTVTSTGVFNVTSTHTSSSPFGTHAEVVIRPETWFQQGSSVDIKAQ